MNDLEAALAAMLSYRAERIEPLAGHRDSTLRGARRRRIAVSVGVGVVSAAVFLGGLGAVRALDAAPVRRAAAPDGVTESSGSFGFTSEPGEYPFVATGEFRGAEWQLRAAGVSPGDEGPVRITLQIERTDRDALITTAAQVRRVDPIVATYEDGAWLFGGDVAMVFGAVDPDAATVDVWMNHVTRPDRTFDAHLFEGYDARTGLRADYYVAFVPANVGIGLVIADDANGEEVGVAAIPGR